MASKDSPVRRKLSAFTIVFLTLAAGCGPFKRARVGGPAGGRYEATWASLGKYPIPEWLKDAKFGIYTHWGVYSVPACGKNGTWYPHNMYREGTAQYKYHVENYGFPTEFGYKDFIPMFKAEKFDAEEWAELFKKAGAQFAGPVAEHHDGFAMWESKWTKWDAAEMGPKRDVVGELEKAIKGKGMRFVTAFHHAQNWYHFPVYDERFDCSKREYSGLYGPIHPKGGKPNEKFTKMWKGKLIEVVDKYDPDFIWSDYQLDKIREDQTREFLAYYYNKAGKRGKEVVVTYKGHDLPAGVGLVDLELGQMDKMTYHMWITDTSVDDQGAWSYVQDAGFKSADTLVDNLVDRVSKNGFLLLNVGPRPDGTIPEPARAALLEMGKWLKVNGEAIYGTRPWIVAEEGPTKIERGGAFSERKGAVRYTGQDIRFTAKGDSLYAVCLDWPGEEVTIKSLRRLHDSEIKSVRMLGVDGDLEWSFGKEGLTVKVPDKKPCDYAYAFKIVRDGRHN
jgi:alpha-L-fucosidase